jgi:hypothetical protein
MKLNVNKADVTTSGVQSQGDFKIKATAKAFNILSSGLYSDKIMAIIRELSCNALDAHIAAGKADIPFEVKLPTHLDPVFYVKDFGVGLSEDEVFNLYTTYFDSTKSDSNEYVGALGLGSKSPFSYTNTFTVESRFKGVKTIYTAFLNEQGLPTIAKMDASPTDEPNGVTVQMPVKKDNIQTFHDKAKVTLMYFNPVPVIKGAANFEPYKVHALFEGTDWAMVKREYYSYRSGPWVKQGPVIYPIAVDVLREHTNNKGILRLFNLDLDIRVQMGDVDVAASREALQYDKRTIANLLNRFSMIATEFEASISKSIADAKSLWEARMMLGTWMKKPGLGTVIRDLVTEGSVKPVWKGKDVEETFKIDMKDIESTVNKVSASHRRKRVNVSYTNRQSGGEKMAVRAHENLIMYVMDTKKLVGNEAVQAELARSSSDAEFILVIPVEKGQEALDQAFEDAKTIAERLGGMDIKKVSDINYTPTRRVSTYKPKQKNMVWTWAGFGNGRRSNYDYDKYSRLTWNTEEIDFSDGGYYVLVERFTPVEKAGGSSIRDIDDVLQIAKYFGAETEFYALTAKQLATAQKEGTWESWVDHVKEEVIAANANDELTDALVAHEVLNCNNASSNLQKLVNAGKKHLTKSDSPFIESLSELLKLKSNKHLSSMGNVINGLRFATGKSDTTATDKRATTLKKLWDVIPNTYPMMAYVGLGNLDNDKRVWDYINMIDEA